MEIVGIEAAGLRGATPPGGWSIDSKPDDVLHTLVFVRTDEGITGVGSVYSSEALVLAALEVLSPLAVGESALEPERVCERMHQHTFWLGRGGALTHAISGIDIALWDILGQVTGQPVGRLLGGRYRTHVQPYASLLIEHPDILTEKLVELRKQGFRAFKIGWGSFGRQDPGGDEAAIRAARQAVGDGALLMVDAGASDGFWPNGLKWAKRTAEMLAAYGIHWFEEPLPPDALADYVALRSTSPVPIAGGETLTRRQTFRPWLEAGAFDIVQPDVTKVGGISEQRRIAWSAQEQGIAFVGHGWNTAVGLAADLQLASALPHTELVEYKTGSPYIDQLVSDRFALDEKGLLAISDRPGLGVALDWEAIGRFTGRAGLASR